MFSGSFVGSCSRSDRKSCKLKLENFNTVCQQELLMTRCLSTSDAYDILA